MDIEYLDIYDANFNHIGTEDRNKVHERGLWHQTIHCWIVRPNGKILVQMRSANIINHPNTLDISAAGHLRAGEKLKDCVREVKEEIGIDIEFSALTYLGYFRRTSDSVRNGHPNHNREFAHVFFVKDDTPLSEYQLQENEVDGIYEMDINKALALFFGETDIIKIDGYKRTEDGLTTQLITATREDFTPHPKWQWLKILIMADRYLKGEKYLAV
ncbi:MAG: NUDIX domain-containing protein [Alphaproteobacteria bacterium]|nr:NUDIX domain-containing protein [Alphaproteobacteria bacterium]